MVEPRIVAPEVAGSNPVLNHMMAVVLSTTDFTTLSALWACTDFSAVSTAVASAVEASPSYDVAMFFEIFNPTFKTFRLAGRTSFFSNFLVLGDGKLCQSPYSDVQIAS